MPVTRNVRLITRAEIEESVNNYIRQILHLTAKTAKVDARIAEIKAAHATDVAPITEEITRLQAEIEAYIILHKQTFLGGKKNTIDTPLGRYGVRKVSSTVIEDAENVIQCANTNGYLDLLNTPETAIVKSALKKRLERGEEIPGAKIITDHEPFVAPTKTLLDQAKSGILPTK